MYRVQVYLYDKYYMNDKFVVYKAQSVAKSLRKRHIILYDKNFLNATTLKSIRIILEITLYYDYYIRQMNVKTNILNGDLEKDVYITIQTNGFVHP